MHKTNGLVVVLNKMISAMGIKQMVVKIRNWYDIMTSDTFTCSIGDIMLLREMPLNNQLLLTSRLLDVERYVNEQDDSFFYQNSISFKAYGEEHSEILGNQLFEDLIKSYIKDGYRKGSLITCDKDMCLIDGNHRMGLQAYLKIETIDVRRIKREIPFSYSSYWYYSAGLSTSFMESIFKRYEELQDWLVESGNTFCVYISLYSSELELDIKRMSRVLRTYRVPNGGMLIQISFHKPNYDVIKGALVSKRAIELEDILTKRAGAGTIVKVSRNCMEGKRLFLDLNRKHERC